MMAFRVSQSDGATVHPHPSLSTIVHAGGFLVQGTVPVHQWTSGTGSAYMLLGHLAGVRRSDGSLAPGGNLTLDPTIAETPEGARTLEGRFVVIAVHQDGTCDIWSDALGRIDVYFQSVGAETVVGSNLDLLPIAGSGGALDQAAMAHSLTIYGGRPAKKQTYFQTAHRLGVGESLHLARGMCEIRRHPTAVPTVMPYTDQDLHRYADLFIEAVRSRASADLNVVSLSSGWDSTAILATLVHLLGPSHVRAIIGRMSYSDRSGVINQFEINRAQAVADHFSVPLEIVEYDFGAHGARYMDEAREILRAHQLNTVGALGNYRMYSHVARAYAGVDATFFTGEASDGAHNFGFSQFVTMFHPASYDFREYADKMATYLYGPTFLREVYAGRQERDPVWRLLKGQHASSAFDAPGDTPAAINRQVLHSMFLSKQRIPFYSVQNVRALTPAGRARYLATSDALYLKEAAADVSPDNMYGWFLRLYNSFYWQAAPVRAREVMADHHGVRLANPFQDTAVLDFLSAMPESWGRGLNFTPTKYPLKWMLANRISYPLHLQTGPHAYIYDVQEGFSISGELLHASGLRPAFVDALQRRKLLAALDPDVFDVPYLDGLATTYLNGQELRGQELNDVFALATHAAIGLYGGA